MRELVTRETTWTGVGVSAHWITVAWMCEHVRQELTVDVCSVHVNVDTGKSTGYCRQVPQQVCLYSTRVRVYFVYFLCNWLTRLW